MSVYSLLNPYEDIACYL